MTAADKLRELHAFATDTTGIVASADWHRAGKALIAAAPEIAAVIEAAEKACREAGANDETAETCHCSTCDICRALAALARRLETQT